MRAALFVFSLALPVALTSAQLAIERGLFARRGREIRPVTDASNNEPDPLSSLPFYRVPDWRDRA